MKYWQRYIADWRGKTAALSLIENGAYSALLDHYYAHEEALEDDLQTLYRICAAISDEEKLAVGRIVKKFFPVGDDGKRHNEKADGQIAEYKKFCEQQRQRRAGRVNGSGKWWLTDNGVREKFIDLGLKYRAGESIQEAKDRCFAELERRKGAAKQES